MAMAMPFSLMLSILDRMAEAGLGDREANGSSRKRTFGCAIIALAMASICLSPPLKFPARALFLALIKDTALK